MSLRYVAFDVGSVHYCLPIAEVQQIVRHESITAVPQSPRYVEGVMNLRGEVVPVIGMRERLDMPGEGEPRKNRVIVVEAEGRLYGLHVDDVRGIVEAEGEDPDGADVANEFVRGIARMGDELLIVLNLQQVVAGPAAKG